MTPGQRAIFTLSAKNELEQWREQPWPCTIVKEPRDNYAQVKTGGNTCWQTVLVLPDGEKEPRPVDCKRYVGPA